MRKSNTLFNVVFALLFTTSAILSGVNLTKMATDIPTEVTTNIQVIKVKPKPTNYNRLMRTKIGPSVVKLFGKRGGGTGFHVKAPSGGIYILTNAHVCELHTDHFLDASYKNSRRVKRRIIEIYADHDLCLVEALVGTKGVEVSHTLSEGDRTFLVGHPRLRPLTVTSGEYIYNTNILIYSCGMFPVKFNTFGKDMDMLFKLINNTCLKKRNASSITNYSKPGASGSPIVNVKGKLVGVLFAGSRADENDSYAVPLKDIKRFLKVY